MRAVATKVHRLADTSVFKKTVLPNGIRVLTETLPSIRSVSLGVWIDIGSRNERPEENGLSHFIEHMLFKGTKRRNAKELASALESLGGSLNGFTAREQTCYHARFLDNHLSVAVDVLADLACNSTITPVHVGREKQVVIEEIKESLDNPSDRIHDLFARTFWGEHPLGQPIMGSMANIRSLTQKRVLDFVHRNYCAGSVVIAASGALSHQKLVALAQRKFRFPKGVADAAPSAKRSRDHEVLVERTGQKQTHVCLGFPAPGYPTPDKMAILALSSYLGGGMSSVLFQKIREDRGLAYSVYTFTDFYRDSGVFGAYLGTDKKHLRQAVEVILREVRTLKRKKLPALQLRKIKSQMQGHLLLGMESTTSRMNRIARQELMTGRYQPLEQMVREIEAVTASRIMELANRIFDEQKVAATVLGPVDSRALNGLL